MKPNEVAGEAAPFTWWGTVDYQEALERMETAHADAISARGGAGAGEQADSRITNKFFYLEHQPVITYGRATPPEELLAGGAGIPRISVARGGLATYHAPGQLVGYILMDLSHRQGGAPDIHAYLRAIEQGLMDFVRVEFGLETTRREGFTGVWTPPPKDRSHPGRKLASIGVAARKWVTSHGFALNLCPDMSGFKAIVPCGITDAQMSSVELELERLGEGLVKKPMEQWARRAHGCMVEALQSEGWLV